jgi:hypothetical protein
MDMIANIAEDLLPLAFPIEKLRLLPGNPNKGDVKAVAASWKQFKQRKPIVARHDGDFAIVIAGNTGLKAARDELGWTHVAVSFADDLDEVHAVGYTLADNETARLGETDEDALAIMQEQAREDDEVWNATGFKDSIVEDFLDDFDKPDTEPLGVSTGVVDTEDEGDEPFEPTGRAPGNPVIQYTIVFDNVEQQQTWFRLMRWLKRSEIYDEETTAGRLIQFVEPLILDGE